MAKKTLNAQALLICDMVDKSRNDSTFVSFVEAMLNLTRQELQSIAPWAWWLKDEASLTATTSGQQYVAAPSDMDFDSDIQIRDETNNRKLRRISPEEADLIDPGRDLSGDEILWWPQRVESTDGITNETYRIYFLYKPDSADTLVARFGINSVVLTTAQSGVIPEKYEPIVINGTLLKVAPRADVDLNISLIARQYEEGKQLLLRDANSSPSESNGLASHRNIHSRVDGVHGPSWPANFDIR